MTHGSLFSGIGGFDFAAEWMGWQNVFHCEWNPFGQRVLKYYWPKAISYNDITKTDFTIYRGQIDILTGGFPCQPYSMAGKRKGKEDERHLWPEMLRAIREIQPRWVVGENVFGLANWNGGLVFHEVQTDLEAAGYEVWPYVLPACAVNAPHRRDRVWFVAKNTRCDGRIQRQFNEEGAEIWQQRDIGAGDTKRVCGEKMAGLIANTDSNGQQRSDCQHEVNASEERQYAQRDIEQMGGNAADTCKIRLSSSQSVRKLGREQRFAIYYEPNTWEKFPTQSPICIGNDGISARLDGITFSKWRNESIKAAGNAIVPQVVYQIFKAIEQYENLKNDNVCSAGN